MPHFASQSIISYTAAISACEKCEQWVRALDVLSEMDAGNYNTPIPYTKADYKTPHQINESIKRGKRVYSKYFETPLPRITTGYSFAMGIDWDKLYSGRFWNDSKKYENGINEDKEGIIDDKDRAGSNVNDNCVDDDTTDGIEKDFHVPFFTEHDTAVMPSKMDVCLLFTAKTGRQCNKRNNNGENSKCDGIIGEYVKKNDDDEEEARIGVLVVATEAICKKITQCGIIDEDTASSKTVGITSSRRSSFIEFDDLERLGIEITLSELEEIEENQETDI